MSQSMARLKKKEKAAPKSRAVKSLKPSVEKGRGMQGLGSEACRTPTHTVIPTPQAGKHQAWAQSSSLSLNEVLPQGDRSILAFPALTQEDGNPTFPSLQRGHANGLDQEM